MLGAWTLKVEMGLSLVAFSRWLLCRYEGQGKQNFTESLTCG
jgi:hypothetical protein